MLNEIKSWWAAVFHIAHLTGRVSIVILFFFSGATVLHLLAKAVGNGDFLLSYYTKVSSIYTDPVAWAASSMLLATTVAMGHMRNLQINEEKYSEELLEKYKKEHEERMKRKQPIPKGFDR